MNEYYEPPKNESPQPANPLDLAGDAIKRFDQKVVAESKEKLQRLSQERLGAIKKEGEEIARALALLMPMPVESEQVQTLIRRHHQNIENFYHVTKELYQGLGELYVIDPDFTAFYNQFAAGLADYLSQAISYYCNTEFKEIYQHR